MATSIGKVVGLGGTITVTPSGTSTDSVPASSATNAVDANYLNVLVGQGTLTLTQKAQLLNGTLTPESLAAAGTITPAQYAALTGHVWTGASGAGIAAAEWSKTLSPADGQLVYFNGCLYQAIGAVGAGVIPPVEAATPTTAAAPRYRLLVQGHSDPVVWDPNVTYYRGQTVSYLGGRYRLDSSTIASGTAPTDDTKWAWAGPGCLTKAEAATLADSNVARVPDSAAATNHTVTTRTPVLAGGDTNRVRLHRLIVYASGAVAVGPIANITFPVPINGKTPFIRVKAFNDIATTKPLTAQPTYVGTQVTGYSLICGVALASGNQAMVDIEVQENQN